MDLSSAASICLRDGGREKTVLERRVSGTTAVVASTERLSSFFETSSLEDRQQALLCKLVRSTYKEVSAQSAPSAAPSPPQVLVMLTPQVASVGILETVYLLQAWPIMTGQASKQPPTLRLLFPSLTMLPLRRRT